MPTQVTIPALGESVTQAVLVKWHVQDGQSVERDQPLCELETDKANVDLPSPEAGVVQRRQAEGDTVKVGEVVAEIDTAAAPTKAGGGRMPTGAPQAGGAGRARVSAAAASPAPIAPPSPGANTIPSGTPTPGRPAEKPPTDESEASSPDQKVVGGDPFSDARRQAAGHPSPAARRILEEAGRKPSDMSGTGKDGRITREDAAAAAVQPAAPGQPAAPASRPPAAARIIAAPSPSEGVRREPMSRIRRKIAERLVAAQQTAAILTTFNEVDMSAVQSLRAKHKERFAEVHGVSLGLMSFFVRACVLALEEFPRINAYIEGDDIVYHDYVHMGIAVSTERGLAVPVMRNAQQLSFAQIESEIKRLATAARDGKLAIEELSGGTFSITNGGIFGSLLSTPILNPPQSGILGMHTIQNRPVAVGERVEVHPMMYVALSYDHRLVDGRESVSFLVRLKGYLEDPARLMLEI